MEQAFRISFVLGQEYWYTRLHIVPKLVRRGTELKIITYRLYKLIGRLATIAEEA